jgi:hypothetical protein
MACAGNSSETCGGPFRLDLYHYGGTPPTSTTTSSSASPTPTVARSWTFLGCYTDNVSGRALPHGEAVPGGSNYMTNDACQASCLAAGYSIAGTEYAGECCKFSSPNKQRDC